MLHKYLRPRFAWGAPWRKHRREGGERLQRQQGWHRRRLLTHQHPWGPPGGPAKGPRMLSGSSAQQQQLSSQRADSGTRDFALCPHPLLRDGWQQAGSEVPTCPGSYLGPTPALGSALQAPGERAPPSGPGVGAAWSPHPRCDHR